MSQMRFVIYHPERGIFLGEAMGLGFWSKLDPVGQTHAVTFESEGIGRFAVGRFSPDDQTECVLVPVTTGNSYALSNECAAAGLPGWDSGWSPHLASVSSAPNE